MVLFEPELIPHWIIALFTILNVVVLAYTLRIFYLQFQQMFAQTREIAEPYIRLKMMDRLQYHQELLERGMSSDIHSLTDWEVLNEGKSNALDLKWCVSKQGRLQPFDIKHIPFIRSAGHTMLRSQHIGMLYQTVPKQESEHFHQRNQKALGDDWAVHAVFTDRSRDVYHAEFKFNQEYHDGFQIVSLEQKLRDKNHACTIPAAHQIA